MPSIAYQEIAPNQWCFHMVHDNDMMAACGLLCGSCPIRRVQFDNDSAKKDIEWYREMGWLSENEDVEAAIRKGLYCDGCLRDRTRHWSPDCWILGCCADDRGLEYCSHCHDFPCAKLVEWSEQNDRYRDAFGRLEKLANSE